MAFFLFVLFVSGRDWLLLGWGCMLLCGWPIWGSVIELTYEVELQSENSLSKYILVTKIGTSNFSFSPPLESCIRTLLGVKNTALTYYIA